MKIEICANSIESAIAAQKAGADRIELCSALSLGGLTPSIGLIKAVKKAIDIPIHVLIRPRPGDFIYSSQETAIMVSDIKTCYKLKVAGVVVGALDKGFNIDENATLDMLGAAEDMEITFHRAFDMLAHPEQELELLMNMGFDRLLTSGQKNKAIDGIALLKHLHEIAEDDIEIMPGSGINVTNVHQFKKAGFSSIHLSASGVEEPYVDSMTEVHFGIRESFADINLIKKIIAETK